MALYQAERVPSIRNSSNSWKRTLLMYVNVCPLMAESRHWLTVNMHAYARYANDRFWPKADIETESKWVSVNVCFGEKSGHSGVRVTDKREWPQSTQRRHSSFPADQLLTGPEYRLSACSDAYARPCKAENC